MATGALPALHVLRRVLIPAEALRAPERLPYKPRGLRAGMTAVVVTWAQVQEALRP